jgi:microcin C transport system ATP-binding protein
MTALNPLFSIGEQIAEVLQLKRGMSASDAWQHTIELLTDTGIPESERRASSFPHQLSGGQRQRAMIAMALAGKPKLLLADEPTTALDVSLRQQILDLLDSLQEKHGMAILLITHDLNMVRRFADKVVVLEGGYVVEQGEVSQVLDKPFHPYTKKLVNSQPTRNQNTSPSSPFLSRSARSIVATTHLTPSLPAQVTHRPQSMTILMSQTRPTTWSTMRSSTPS